MVRLLVLHLVRPALVLGHPVLLLTPRLLVLVRVVLVRRLLARRRRARVVRRPRVVVGRVRSRLVFAVRRV